MSLWKRLTSPTVELDRIKVLWIDDRSENLGQVAWLSRMFGKYFDIYHASVPEEVGVSLSEVSAEVVTQYGGAAYELSEAPFDVYLADWDLTAAGVSQSLGRPSEAKNADAAGLATATLSACHFPRHPAAIIPYSAQWASLEAHGKLHQSVAPGYIYVAWQEGQQLKADQVTKVLPIVVCACFRKSLAQAARWGHIYFPSQTIGDATSGVESTADVREWLERSYIEYETAWGRRRVRQMAMWLDLFEPDTTEAPAANRLARLWTEQPRPDNQPTAEVQDPTKQRRDLIRRWYGTLPRYLDDLSKVIELVDQYWRLATSERSRLRYRLSNILATDPEHRNAYDDLEGECIAQAMGLRYADLRDASEKQLQTIDVTDGRWACPPIYDVKELGDGPEGLERQRLAVLMLCVLARARQPAAEANDEPDWVEKQWIGQAILSHALYSQVESLLTSDQRAKAVDLIYSALCKTVEADSADDRDARFRTRHLPKDPGEYISRLINPLPSTLLAPGMGSQAQLGKALSKRCLSMVELWSDNPPQPHGDVSEWPALKDAVPGNSELGAAVRECRLKQAPYGFRMEAAEDKYPILAPDPAEAAAVRKIFDRFLAIENAWSFLENVKRDAAIPRPKSAGREKAWDVTTLLISILGNEAYVGASVVKGGGHYKDQDSVVDTSVFDRVQRKRYHPTHRETRILQNWAKEQRWPEERWWNWLKRQVAYE